MIHASAFWGFSSSCCLQFCCFLCSSAAWHQVLLICLHCGYHGPPFLLLLFLFYLFTLSPTCFGGRVGRVSVSCIIWGQWKHAPHVAVLYHNLSSHCFPFLKSRTKRYCWLWLWFLSLAVFKFLILWFYLFTFFVKSFYIFFLIVLHNLYFCSQSYSPPSSVSF